MFNYMLMYVRQKIKAIEQRGISMLQNSTIYLNTHMCTLVYMKVNPKKDPEKDSSCLWGGEMSGWDTVWDGYFSYLNFKNVAACPFITYF